MNNKSSVLFTLYILFQVVLSLVFFWAIDFEKLFNPPLPVEYYQVKTELNTLKTDYKNTEQNFLQVKDSLKIQLREINSLLHKEQKKVTGLEIKIRQNLETNWDSLPIPEKLTSCDSLRQYTEEYTEQHTVTDSLKDHKIEILEFFTVKQGEQLNLCNQFAQQSHSLLEVSHARITEQDMQLQELNLRLDRNKKWQKRLGGGAVVLAAIASVLIITAQ